MPFPLSTRNIDYLYEQIKLHAESLKIVNSDDEMNANLSVSEVALILELTDIGVDFFRKEIEKKIKEINLSLAENEIEDFLIKIDLKKTNNEIITLEEEWLFQVFLLRNAFYDLVQVLNKIHAKKGVLYLHDNARKCISLLLQNLSDVSRILKQEKTAREAFFEKHKVKEEVIHNRNADFGFLYRIVEGFANNVRDEIHRSNRKVEKEKILFLNGICKETRVIHRIENLITEFTEFQDREKKIKTCAAAIHSERRAAKKSRMFNWVKRIWQSIRNCFHSKKQPAEKPVSSRSSSYTDSFANLLNRKMLSDFFQEEVLEYKSAVKPKVTVVDRARSEIQRVEVRRSVPR